MSESTLIETVVIVGLALVAIVVVIKFEVVPKVYDVRLSERGVEFVLFSCMPFYTLKFENIEEVVETRGGYKYVFAYNFKNRFSQACFLIRKKKGFFTRQVLITPPNPSLFAEGLARAGVSVKSYPVASAGTQGEPTA